MTRPAQVPSCQMNLDEAVEVDELEGWMHECTAFGCSTQVQGGRAGMAAHIATVHDAEAVAQ